MRQTLNVAAHRRLMGINLGFQSHVPHETDTLLIALDFAMRDGLLLVITAKGHERLYRDATEERAHVMFPNDTPMALMKTIEKEKP